MTGTRTNVVPFERPAQYWALRARRLASPAQLPDAARLMRKALEKSGDSGIALELSQIYARMHCYTASERYLIRACAREGLSGTVCFLLGCAALNRDQEELGERAIDLSLRLDPDGPFSEQAQEILESYPWRQAPWRPRCARGMELSRAAQRHLALGQVSQAADCAKRAWRRAHTPEIALQLGTLLPPERGSVFLSYAAGKMGDKPRPWLLLALVCHRAGREEEAAEALNRAADCAQTISDAEAYCQAAWEMGRPDAALKLVNGCLEAMPASADYLRLKYLTLVRLQKRAAADRTLDTLLEIDPDDPFALRCRRHPMEDALDPDRVLLLSVMGSMVYAAPERLKYGPLNRILHMMVMMLDGALDTETIYRLLPPLWRKMTPAEKRACDGRRDKHYPTALAVYMLSAAGRTVDARRLFEGAAGKKRILRFLHRFLRQEAREHAKGESQDALHQF